MKFARVYSLFLTLCFLVFPSIAFTAAATGTILGRVVDPSGAVVPDATVTVHDMETSAIRRSMKTSDEGVYSFPLLDSGVYRVTIEKTGFRTVTFDAVKLDVNDTRRLDAALTVQPLTQELRVPGDSAPVIQTDTSTLGVVVGRREIGELPLNERNFLNLATLTPGIHTSAEGSQNSAQGAAISVNGAREQSNNVLLDGGDNNDLGINHYTVLPSAEAIDQFRVQSANSSADFGRSGGGQINIVLKRGTNNVHGSAFGFLRNRHLDAKNFFDRPDCTSASLAGTCAEIPRLDRKQFGGSLGGPVFRDKTFYFASYEGLRLQQAVTREATVPSQNQRSAVLAAVPSGQQNPAGLAVLSLIPAANVGANLATSNRFVGTPVLRNDIDQFLVKLNHVVNESHSLSGFYALFDENRQNPFDPFFASTSLPGYGTNWKNRGQNISIALTSTVSPRIVNEARLGFNRLSAGIFQQNLGFNGAQALGFPELSQDPINFGYPNISIAGFDGIGEPINTPQERHDNTLQFADTVAWTPESLGGRHRFKMGFDVRKFEVNFYLNYLSRGAWQFVGAFSPSPLEDLVRGMPVGVTRLQGSTDAALRTTAYDFFVHDDIQLNPQLTLNLGLRYEYNAPPVDLRNRISVPDPSAASLTCTPAPDCQFIQVGTQGIPRSGYDNDINNFAPRIGLAWRPFDQRRMVVRTAYGIFYDATIVNVNTGPRFNPPFAKVVLALNNGTSTIQTVLSQPPFAPPHLPLSIAPDFRDPYMQHWNVDLQYELSQGLALDLAYVGSKGTNLIARRNVNQPLQPGPPPFPQFGAWQVVESASSSTYHSMQMRFEKKWRSGISWLTSYTWSKSIDDASAFVAGAGESGLPQDSWNRRAERGLSSFDARHRLVVSFLADLPFGEGHRWLSDSGAMSTIFGDWHVSGIWSSQSGQPFTVNRAIDQSGTGNVFVARTDRPDQISDPFLAGPVANHPDPACRQTIANGGRAPSVVRDPSSWFNPCAFAPATRFGNAGRNSLIGPSLHNMDLALIKTIPFAEERRLEFRFEVFNVFNHPNFDLPDRIFDSPTFGRIRSANAYGGHPPRQIQLALRYAF